jgi:hypothetical protein
MISNQNTSNNQNPNTNEVIIKEIIYGSIAFWLGKKADETVSHKWAVYVRGINNEDISYFIKEVTFTLHSSFNNNVRVVNKFPFELYEAGWGEFDIKITINFIDETIKPAEFIHPLKLYPSQAHVQQSTKKPIVSENYDDIIFINPKKTFREILLNPPLFKREYSNIHIPMNVDEERKSIEHSIITNEERNSMNVDITPNIKKDNNFKFTSTIEKFDNFNLNSQMDLGVSQFKNNQSLEKKLDDLQLASTLGYKAYDSNLDNVNANADMQVEINPLIQNNVNNETVSVSMMSNNIMVCIFI